MIEICAVGGYNYIGKNMTSQMINMNHDEFLPRDEFILVRPEELPSEKITESGLIIPLTKKTITGDRPTSGTVISMGTGTMFRKNDFIIWPETDGLDLEFNDGTFLLLRDESVIGKKKQKGKK